MAGDDTNPGMNTGARFVYGPRGIGTLVPTVTRTAFRKRSPATAMVLTDWAAIVGPALADVTVPRRLSGGTLTIACAGPIAMELQHLSGELMARINGHLGGQTVTALRFMQGPVTPVRAPAALPPPSPAVTAQAEKAVSAVPEGPLRDALASLGRAVLTKRKPSSRSTGVRKRSTPNPEST